MKFRQKIFISTLIVFIIAFDAGAFFLTSHAYDFNRRREMDSGVREQGVILSAIEGRIANAQTVYPGVLESGERLTSVIKPLANYYRHQGVFLALFDGEESVYTELGGIDTELLRLEDDQSKNVTDRIIGEKRYALVASKLPDTHLTFVYARDISQIDDFRTDISRVFMAMNVVVLVLLGGALYLLLRSITKPITQLQTITAEIADGAYEKRITTKRTDELGALARSFNTMADSVEKHMAQLTDIAEEKQQFIDDLTHEMKTPLTSILGYAEYLQNAKCTEEERMIAAGHLYSMTARFKNLSDKLLSLTLLRGESIEMQPVDIPALFDALAEATRPILAVRNLTLTTSYCCRGHEIPENHRTILRGMPAGACPLGGDETLLLSMLTNLVDNAAKASKNGGTIAVSAYLADNDGAFPVLEVSDNGCGMPAYEIEKITAPFYRVDKSRSREFGGVGLGLSIVSQIAKLHGASVEIISEVGKGTTVRICFTTR